MAVAGGVRRKTAAGAGRDQAQRPCHRGAGLCRKSAQELHAVGRQDQDLADARGLERPADRCRISRGRCGVAALRRHAGQGDRLGADPGCRDRAAQPRAGRQRRSRHRHQYSVPLGIGDASGCPRQRHRHRLHRTRIEEPDAAAGGIRRSRALRGCRRHPWRQSSRRRRPRRIRRGRASGWMPVGRRQRLFTFRHGQEAEQANGCITAAGRRRCRSADANWPLRRRAAEEAAST